MYRTNKANLFSFSSVTDPNDREPYMIDEPDADTTYICLYARTDEQKIKRVKKSGTITTIMYANAKWADRATATYFPPNEFPAQNT